MNVLIPLLVMTLSFAVVPQHSDSTTVIERAVIGNLEQSVAGLVGESADARWIGWSVDTGILELGGRNDQRRCPALSRLGP